MTTTPNGSRSGTDRTSGIAVLQDEQVGGSTWTVNGVALSEDAITVGKSGQRRLWPADAIRRAADQLEGRPIVKNFHDLEGSADADDVIGRITEAGYQDGLGLVFQGEISDRSIAEKVGNDFLEVSAVPGIGAESYDPDRDAHVVEEITGFRDVAVVPDGADRGNDIALGERPAIAALSREALAQAQPWDALQDDITVSDPIYSGTVEDSWDAPTLEGTYDGDVGRARDAALIIRGEGDTFDDLSLFVVDGNGNLNLAALRAAKSRAPQTSGVSGDVLDRVQTKINRLAADEFGQDWSDGSEANAADPGDPAPSAGAHTDADADADAHAGAAPRVGTGFRRAMAAELELTGSTPDRCRSIKDGAEPVDADAAADMLGLSEDESPTPEGPVDVGDPLAQRILGEPDEPEPSRVTRTFRPDDDGFEVDMEAAQAMLGLGADGEAADTDAVDMDVDALQTEGDAVRWESDAGGEREPDDVRYGVVVNNLPEGDDEYVMVAVYQPTADMDGWEPRDESMRMSKDRLERVGGDGVGSLPAVSQVT